MSEQEFPKGLFAKAPREGAPDFVKGALSIKREEMIEWLQSKDNEWINLDIKEAKSTGKWYASVNSWKKDYTPKEQSANDEVKLEDIPF
jgi:hypothetical protein